MDSRPRYLCSPVIPGVEVVTMRAHDGQYETCIHGGPLDGDSYTCRNNPRAQHDYAIGLARAADEDLVGAADRDAREDRAALLKRMLAWPRRR